MQIAVAMLPALGLDGLSGVGGSVLFDTEQYDSMMHLHVLLSSPRTGVIKAIAFEPGATKPERWVPGDVASYATLNWNFETSLKAIETLFDSFRGDGDFAQNFAEFQQGTRRRSAKANHARAGRPRDLHQLDRKAHHAAKFALRWWRSS